MAQKNDTTALILAFVVTAGLIGGGFWWFTQRSGSDLNKILSTGTNPSTGSNDGSNSAPPTGEPSPQGSLATGEGFASVQKVPSGLFSYGGSTTWAPIRLIVDPVIQSTRPEFRLRYVDPISGAPGSGTGIRMLLQDEIAFAQSSRPLSDQENQTAAQRGIKLKQIPVAIDGIAIAVNPSLNIPGLTIDQIKSIYSGTVTNWSQVGGPDLPIQPFERPPTAGAGTIEVLLGDRKPGPNVQDVSTTTAGLRKLAISPGGIYFSTATELVPQCTVKPVPIGRQPGQFVPPYQEPLVAPSGCPAQRNRINASAFQSGQYPLTRNLFVIVKQNGGAEQQAGEAYANFLLSPQGQALIAKAGFVSIR
ncbi:PstS family phosphate ABC transporter substrate-binding protein [Stenomitos frigidus]|uniref:Phosphate ABC transporter substrate-binding protein n=1 Tax=Stenomitos frigidus ULC18 TaxID=2107698 RepID=A0A2T1DZ47_9CYAN|nr:PstS family phosphate ABC transporter substrate-binding protein [Stenomitos frigidus]PSB25777.1 phosphate ABC transporter substrate-binding protein [Stenomitos frigidus ULC18]